MSVISITIPGQPIPKARPRFSNGRVYTPTRTKEYESRIKQHLKHLETPITNPVEVQITAILKRPKYMQKPKFYKGLIPHTKRPDLDNIVKAVLDALNNTLKDDAQVHTLRAQKFYAEIDQLPRTIITIKETEL